MFTGRKKPLNIFYSIFDHFVNFSPSPRISDVTGKVAGAAALLQTQRLPNGLHGRQQAVWAHSEKMLDLDFLLIL